MLSEYVNKYREISAGIRTWDSLTPKKKWSIIHDIAQYAGYLIGFRFLGDCEIFWFSYFGGFVVGLYSILATYTFIVYSLEAQFTQGLACFAISGLYYAVSLNISIFIFIFFSINEP